MSKPDFQMYRIHEGLALLFDLMDDPNSPLPPEQLGAKIKELFEKQDDLFVELRKSTLNWQAQEKACREEASRLTEMARRAEAHKDRLKAMMLQAMNESGLTKVEFPTGGGLRVQKNGQDSIELTIDPKDLPDAWRKESVTYSLDREAVLGAVQVGVPLPDTIKVSRGSHLRLS